MTRPQDWPARLAAFLEAREPMPFAWVSNDCATFAAAWIQALTGVLVFQPPYSDEVTALRFIGYEGGMRAAATRILGAPMPDTAKAQRGDVALISNAGRETLGVITGAHVASPGDTSYMLIPRTAIVCAWHV